MSEGPIYKPESDVFTVLLIIATVLVLAATVFLIWHSNTTFGSWNPLSGA